MVRDFDADDYLAVLSLWEKTGMGGLERGDDLPIINETIAKGGKLLVLTDDADLIIGSSWMTQDGRRMFLHHFAIDPEYQGRGLSHLLMRESMSWMEDIGLQIKLEVHRSNEIAKALYCRYGFQELGDYVVFIIREPKKKDAD